MHSRNTARSLPGAGRRAVAGAMLAAGSSPAASLLAASLLAAFLLAAGALLPAIASAAQPEPPEPPEPPPAATPEPAEPPAAAAPEPPAAPESPADLDVPGEDEIAEHRTYDPGPKLQRTPGGSLIVDAFIMDGPVRVAIERRESGEVLFEQESDTLFSFEVSRSDLDAEPEEVVVKIFLDGELAHKLTMDR